MSVLSKFLTTFNRKIILFLSFGAFLLLGYRAQAKSDTWVSFPCTIQGGFYEGTTKEIMQLIASYGGNPTTMGDNVKGGGIDIGVLQIDRFISKYFQCYPKVGLAINYGRFEDSEHFATGFVYVEPQYDYLTSLEVFPRLGVGVAYLSDGEEFSLDPEDLYSNVLLALAANIRLTPSWQITPSVGFSYMPMKINKQEEGADEDPITMAMASVNLGYTLNPRPRLIPHHSKAGQQDYRIEIGPLFSLKEFAEKYYYVVGGYGQWSIPLIKNHALLLGSEVIYDMATEQKIRNHIVTSPIKFNVSGGHEFRWGRMLFGQQIGIDFINYEIEKGDWPCYARLGVSGKFTESLLIGINVTIRATKEPRKLKRDFIDVRIAYLP